MARSRVGNFIRLFGTAAILLLAASCATRRDTRITSSLAFPNNEWRCLKGGKPIATYPVSTSKFGLGDYRGSWGTPLGELEVAKKSAMARRVGAVFKDRRLHG